MQAMGPARLDMFGLEPGILRGFLENVNYFYDIKSLFLVFFGVIAATFVNLPIWLLGYNKDSSGCISETSPMIMWVLLIEFVKGLQSLEKMVFFL